DLQDELSGKRLELLKESMPALKHVAMLWNSTNPDKAREVQATQVAAQSLGVELQYLGVRESADLNSAFDVARRQRAEGLVTFFDGLMNANQARIAALAAESGLPSMHSTRGFVEAGGLMAYGPRNLD